MTKSVQVKQPPKRNLLIKVGLVISILTALASPLLLSINRPLRLPSIIQIGDIKPHCTAFVVSDRYAITAKHCVASGAAMMFGAADYTPVIAIFKDHNVIGKAETVWNARPVDVVALRGDFTNYEHLTPQSTIIYMSPTDHYKACGYPYGTPHLICSDIQIGANMKEAYSGVGYIIYGFSGGPVINVDKNVAVGVNSAIGDGMMIFTPLIALKEMLDLEDDL